MTELATARLRLRQLAYDDAEFILRLLNDPGFLRYIGDKGVRSLADAREYLARGPMASYARRGYGLYRVGLADDDVPLGICGLVRREGLDEVDLGFAFMPGYRGRGYATEAGAAVLEEAQRRFAIHRVLAITAPDNSASMAVLERLGFRFERLIRLLDEGVALRLYQLEQP